MKITQPQDGARRRFQLDAKAGADFQLRRILGEEMCVCCLLRTCVRDLMNCFQLNVPHRNSFSRNYKPENSIARHHHHHNCRHHYTLAHRPLASPSGTLL